MARAYLCPESVYLTRSRGIKSWRTKVQWRPQEGCRKDSSNGQHVEIGAEQRKHHHQPWAFSTNNLQALASQAIGHGILDGERGFHVMAGSDRVDWDRMARGLGSEWLITDVEPKIFPAIARNAVPHLATAALVAEHHEVEALYYE